MALTKATNRMISGSPASIIDYGADPTGVSDSTTAIQTAVNENTVVFVPVGRFRVDGTITVPDGHNIIGDQGGGLFLNVLTTPDVSLLFKDSASTAGAIVILKSSSTLDGLQFLHQKTNGATTGIIQIGTGSENAVYNIISNCSMFGDMTADRTGTNTCFGIYAAAGTVSTVVYWNRINNVQITNVDVGIKLQSQANANHISNTIVKEAHIAFWLDGGASECIDNIFTGIGAYNGLSYSPVAIVFQTTGVVKYNTFVGSSEMYGQAFNIGAGAETNYYTGYFNEVVASSPADKDMLITAAESKFTGYINHLNEISSQPAHTIRSERFSTAAGFSTIMQLKSTTAQAAGVGAGLTFGGIFTDAGLEAEWAEVAGVKENSTSSDFAGELQLKSRPNGGNCTVGAVLDSSQIFRPATDNTKTLGSASYRWSEVFAGNATINTSDASDKQQIRNLSDAETAVAVRIKSLLKAYKFNDAVESKGDSARIHVGVIAQDVEAAFSAEGLDANNYSLFCRDTWYVDADNVVYKTNTDQDGEVIEGLTEVTKLGVRYSELLAFVISAL